MASSAALEIWLSQIGIKEPRDDGRNGATFRRGRGIPVA
jgi:hypothetical protein